MCPASADNSPASAIKNASVVSASYNFIDRELPILTYDPKGAPDVHPGFHGLHYENC
jgi:hypothetical protein